MVCAEVADEVRWLSKEFWVEATLADVQAALDCGASISTRDEHGSTPLSQAAAFSSEPAVVVALIEAGAEVLPGLKAGEPPSTGQPYEVRNRKC